MTDPKPPHPWMPLQIFAGRASSGSSRHSCLDFTLRPSPARFSRPQGHADSKSIISHRCMNGRARTAQAALVGVAAVWGLTFPMVQDAVERLPAMTFLAYRFLAAALVVAVVFRNRMRALSPAGWRAGLAMGAFLTAGYVSQTIGLEHTSASNAGFITGLFVVITPLLGALVLRQRIAASAWAAAIVSAVGLYLLTGTHGGLRADGDGLVLLCAIAFSAHILVTHPA